MCDALPTPCTRAHVDRDLLTPPVHIFSPAKVLQFPRKSFTIPPQKFYNILLAIFIKILVKIIYTCYIRVSTRLPKVVLNINNFNIFNKIFNEKDDNETRYHYAWNFWFGKINYDK